MPMALHVKSISVPLGAGGFTVGRGMTVRAAEPFTTEMAIKPPAWQDESNSSLSPGHQDCPGLQGIIHQRLNILWEAVNQRNLYCRADPLVRGRPPGRPLRD